jgi:hypothetical protein
MSVCTANTIPVNAPVISTTACDCRPILYVCSIVSRQRGRRVNAVLTMSANNINIAPSWASSSSTNETNPAKADVIVARA